MIVQQHVCVCVCVCVRVCVSVCVLGFQLAVFLIFRNCIDVHLLVLFFLKHCELLVLSGSKCASINPEKNCYLQEKQQQH